MEKKIIISLFIIVIIIIVGISFYKLYKPRVHNVILDKSLELTGDISKKYPSNLLPVSKNGVKYTLGFSIYSRNVSENSIWGSNFRGFRGIISHYGSPNVYFNSKSNTLRVSIAYKDDLSNKTYYNFDFEDFKYQRWEHVVVVVDNRYVSVYLNGVLEKSVKLPNIPWISQNSLYVGQKNNNFNGKIKDIEYFNDALKIHEVEKLYASKK